MYVKGLIVVTAFAAIAGCGRLPQNHAGEASDLEWSKSRKASNRYAFLAPEDLNDQFLLGVSVIGVKGFLSGALNMSISPQKVNLKLAGADKLEVRTKGGEAILTFGATKAADKYEIDFASMGNDLKFQGSVEAIGGMYTAESRHGAWLSSGAPLVKGISQDDNTLVADLVHTVKQVEVDDQGNVTKVVTPDAGEVTVRVYLIRQRTLPQTAERRTVKEGLALNVGYFGASMSDDDEAGAEADQAVQRMVLPDKNGKITFYLKDFPAQFVDVGKKAVLSWNKAFRRDVLRVAIAPAGMDVGDPRRNVIKWFDGTDNSLGWAGVAKMIVDPDSGLVMGGNVYIQGSTVVDMYRKIMAYSQAVAHGTIHPLAGQIGDVSFENDKGEVPVVPYLGDAKKDFNKYMQDYYLGTITHEVGHVLGLRHNFEASAALDASGDSASIMDYTPRKERAIYVGPGYYDVAAIRWGYYGEVPAQVLAFCTDEDAWKKWDCNKGDFGDPVDYVVRGLIEGTSLVAQRGTAPTADEQFSSMGEMVENALKMVTLKAQMPDDLRAKMESQLPAAYRLIFDAQPVAGMSAEETAVATANLAKLKQIAQTRLDALKKAGKVSADPFPLSS